MGFIDIFRNKMKDVFPRTGKSYLEKYKCNEADIETTLDIISASLVHAAMNHFEARDKVICDVREALRDDFDELYKEKHAEGLTPAGKDLLDLSWSVYKMCLSRDSDFVGMERILNLMAFIDLYNVYCIINGYKTFPKFDKPYAKYKKPQAWSKVVTGEFDQAWAEVCGRAMKKEVIDAARYGDDSVFPMIKPYIGEVYEKRDITMDEVMLYMSYVQYHCQEIFLKRDESEFSTYEFLSEDGFFIDADGYLIEDCYYDYIEHGDYGDEYKYPERPFRYYNTRFPRVRNGYIEYEYSDKTGRLEFADHDYEYPPKFEGVISDRYLENYGHVNDDHLDPEFEKHESPYLPEIIC